MPSSSLQNADHSQSILQVFHVLEPWKWFASVEYLVITTRHLGMSLVSHTDTWPAINRLETPPSDASGLNTLRLRGFVLFLPARRRFEPVSYDRCMHTYVLLTLLLAPQNKSYVNVHARWTLLLDTQ